jgi:hypothetical protein
MQVIPFTTTRDRIAQGHKRSLPLLTAAKGQKLYAIRRRDGKYFHSCYVNPDVAHVVMIKLFSADDANFVKSVDQTVLSRICKPEHLV